MKKSLLLIFTAAIILSSCEKKMNIYVGNPLDIARENETVEIVASSVLEKCNLTDPSLLAIYDKDKNQVPFQICHNDILIFQVSLGPKESAVFKACRRKEDPIAVTSKVFGRPIPEHMNDFAWENDRIAFRTHGKEMEKNGIISSGFDVWVKRVPEMIINRRYSRELDENMLQKIHQLDIIAPDQAKILRDSISSSVDHGDGLDNYVEGNSLGAGAMAPFIGNTLHIGHNYDKIKLLDLGPIRFCAELSFPVIEIDGKQVKETRLITLDAGSQMNCIREDYTFQAPVYTAAGIALHGTTDYVLNAKEGYICYADPADPVNGQTYVGIAFVQKDTKALIADDHALVRFNFSPNRGGLEYYCGAGWSKYGFETPKDWESYMADFALKIRNPIEVMIETNNND